MTFLDFCAGIGGFRLGLELAGYKCIGFCEKDKFAVKSYRAMFDTEGEWYADDVTKLRPEEIPRADIWCFGFPCQDISVAGKQRGIRGKRSGIYFSIIDLIKGKEEKDKPTYLLIENVKNLLSINNGFDFATVLSELDQAGYDAIWQVLNSKDFGVPQNRERVFIIANLRTRGRREILPITGENTAALKQIISGSQGYRVYDAEGVSCAIQSSAGGVGAKTGLYCIGNINPSGNGASGNVYNAEGISTTLTANGGGGGAKTGLYFIDQSNTKPHLTENSRCITSRYTAGVVNRAAMNSGVLEAYPILTPDREEKRQNGRRMKNADEPMFTLTSQDRHGVAIKNATKKGYVEANIGDGIYLNFPNSTTRRGRVGKGVTGTLDTSCAVGTLDSNYRIRRLTPKECFRLQGFPDELFEKAKAVNSDAQLYKQAGNAVTVNVAFAVAKSLPKSE
ncbi:DNA (cytosine-5-)-methyltransferase [Clostridium tyrobutyricum]|uniref:DNA (cytosine-5-)-methyltransferase n=1 Tax=Clostridium tyrobutyricum TaxID=1519 RepID=UPI00311A9A99